MKLHDARQPSVLALSARDLEETSAAKWRQIELLAVVTVKS
jgi:hypothetical protein